MENALRDTVKEEIKMIKTEVIEPPTKKQRTSEDFSTFCQFVLEYENYESVRQEETRRKNTSSPVGSTADSFLSDSNSSLVSQDIKTSTDNDSDEEDDSWDLITCYCMKPFAGRPMIECSECLTWVHLSCAKVRRNNIPEEFICQMCKEAKILTRRSQRNRSEGGRMILQ